MRTITRAVDLLDNGYQVIPVTKESVPLVSNFFKDKFDHTDAADWENKFPNASLSLACGVNSVYAIDFDVDDPKVANWLKRRLRKSFPKMPIRLCNEPRFAVVFRAGESLLEYTNAHSTGYRHSRTRKLNMIEMMGKKLINMYGTHRKTGNNYRWYRNLSPHNIGATDLPVLEVGHIRKIFKAYEKKLEGVHKVVMESTFSKINRKDAFETAMPTRRYTEDKIDELLEVSTGNDYHSWVKVGMALHSHYGRTVQGLRKWDGWSRRFDGYKKGACKNKWRTFSSDGGVTLGTLNYEHKRQKMKDLVNTGDLLEHYLERYVLIKQGKLVGDLHAKPSEAILKLDEFQIDKSNIVVEIPIETATGKPSKKEMPVHKLWMKDLDRITCQNTTYRPIRDRIIEGLDSSTENLYWNTYVPAVVDLTDATDKLHHFTTHMEYLFGDGEDADWMYNWLAQLVQEPTVKRAVNPLHISAFEGTGRQWLTKLISHLVGETNRTKTNIENMTNPTGFTPFLYENVVCFLDEVKAKGNDRFKVNDRMKSFLSDAEQEINLKHVAQVTMQTYTRFFMMSNHIDALVLDETDRRVEFFICRQLPKSTSYYNKLYSLVEKPNQDVDFLNQVYTFLMNYEVNVLKLSRSRDTEARRTVIRSTKSPTANAFLEFKSVIDSNVFYPEMMYQFISKYHTLHYADDNVDFVNPKEIRALENEYVQNSQLRSVKMKRGDVNLTVKTFKSRRISRLSEPNLRKLIHKAKSNINFYFKQWEQKTNEKTTD